MNKIHYWLLSFLLCLSFTGCEKKTVYVYPFQNPNLSVDERATDLVSRLTLDEKIAQMLNGTPAIERLGIPSYDWWNECLHGVANTPEYGVTVYPQAIAMAAGWDLNAIRQMGDYTAVEGRAVYNTARAKGDYRIFHGLTFWSPNINIFRDPRWGRGQETYGEDPFLTAGLGKNFVLGLQGDDETYLKVAACAKHYAVHSGPEPLRHVFDASVSNYDLWDTYLPAFKILVEDANVVGVMCAYNAFEGQPCCGSDKLLVDILRNDWGFTGYVTSDCGAIDDFYKKHNTHVDAPAAAADAVFHGTDVDCGREAYYGLKEAVERGIITESQIDVSLKRLIEIRIRLGMFDPENKVPFNKIDSTSLETKEHQALALKMSRQSMVLLKNDGILPLKKENIKKIAVVGPNADSPEVQLGNYNGHPSHIITPLEGIRTKLPNVEVIYEQISNLVDTMVIFPIKNAVSLPNGSGKGFTTEFYDNPDLKGQPVYRGTTEELLFTSKETRDLLPGQTAADITFAPGVPLTQFSSRFEGVFEAPFTGAIELNVDFDDAYRLFIDGKKVAEHWSTPVRTNQIYTLNAQEGKKYAIKIEHAQWERGAHVSLDIQYRRPIDVKSAVEKVKDADVIVYVGGISPRLEGEEMKVDFEGFEGGDRTSILLPKTQTQALKALQATGKPVVFVLMTGSAIALPWESENIPAILNAWYGGESAGTAIADILFGDYNPSGHLPVTFYANDTDLPDFLNYDMANRTYKYFTGKALYPFGYGLSYTTFTYEWAKLPKKEYAANETIQCTVNVKNTGSLAGDAVSQVYIKYPNGKGYPLKELRAFERKNIQQGKSYKMNVSIPIEQLAKWDESAGKLVVPTGTYSIFAGSHSEDEAAIANFEIK
jgi:beta-glucosidase